MYNIIFGECFIVSTRDIVIYTRTGGNNRSTYAVKIDAMKKIKGYKFDIDEPFDNTYASFHYDAPEHHQVAIDRLIEIGSVVDQTQRWKSIIGNFKEDHSR